MSRTVKALLAITIVALIIRLQNLGTMSLWLDEIWSVNNSLNSPLEILLSQDPARSFPFHLVLHVSLWFGNNEFMARLPSAIFGVLAIPLIYLLGKELYNRNVGLLSAFLLAFWPYHVWYSQEARMYSLFCLITMASMLIFHKLLAKGSKKLWNAYLAVTLFGCYTHFYFVFVIGTQILYAIYMRAWKLPKWTKQNLLTLAVTMFFTSILIIPFIQGAVNMILSGPGLSIPWGLEATDFWYESFAFLSIGSFGMLFAIPIFFIALFYGWKQTEHRNTSVLVAIWIFAPLTLLFILTVMLRPLTGNRYLIFIMPAFIIMLSHGLLAISKKLKPKLPKKQTLIAFYFATVIFVTLAAPTILFMPLTPREDWRACVAYLNANVGDNETILCYPAFISACLDYYIMENMYELFGTVDKTCARIGELNGTVWLVLYSWGDSKIYFESRVFPLGFEVVNGWYQIFIYKR